MKNADQIRLVEAGRINGLREAVVIVVKHKRSYYRHRQYRLNSRAQTCERIEYELRALLPPEPKVKG